MYIGNFYATTIECIGFIVNLLMSLLIILIPLLGMCEAKCDKIWDKMIFKSVYLFREN